MCERFSVTKLYKIVKKLCVTKLYVIKLFVTKLCRKELFATKLCVRKMYAREKSYETEM